MTDREEFEEHADDCCLMTVRLSDGAYARLETEIAWKSWQACAAIKQRRIDELEAQLHMARFGAGGDAQNNPAGGRGFSGTRVSFAEPMTMSYKVHHPEPQEPKP